MWYDNPMLTFVSMTFCRTAPFDEKKEVPARRRA